MTELRKSINAILYQRVTSPLFGTFLVSWIVWNWKIIYTTFFIDEDKIIKNKIDYIVENFSDSSYLIWYPLLSTLILLTLIPFLSNGAYWLSLKFEKWKVDSKNKIEKQQLLTLAQSIELRGQIIESERKFESLLQNKNDEIKQLKLLVEESSKGNENINTKNVKISSVEDKEEKEVIETYRRIRDNPELLNAVNIINHYTLGGYTGLGKTETLDTKILTYFISNDLLENIGKGDFKWTKKGRRLNQLISEL
jgi:hypothetical protein